MKPFLRQRKSYFSNLIRQTESPVRSLSQHRDKLGRTPIVVGNKPDAYAVTSESTSFPNLDYEIHSYLGPGEIVQITADGIPMAGKLSVLNANYIKECLKDYYELPIDGLCKHEFVFDGLKAKYGGAHSDASHITTTRCMCSMLSMPITTSW